MSRRRGPSVTSLWGRIVLFFILFAVFTYSAALVFLMEKGVEHGTLEEQTDALTHLLQDPHVLTVLLLMQAVIGLVLVAAMTLFVDRRPLSDLGLGQVPGGGVSGVLWGLLVGGVLACVVALFIAAASGRHIHLEFFRNAHPGSVAGLLGVLVAAGFMEELCFRGYLYVNLRENYDPSGTILLTSVGFAAIHGLNPGGSLLAGFNIFLIGVVLAQLRELTGGLAVPFGLHLGWNLLLGMGFGVPVSGISLPSALRIFTDDVPSALGGGVFGPEASLVFTVLFGGVALVLARKLMPPGDDSTAIG